MIGVRENRIHRVPLVDAVAQTQAVARAIAARDFDTAMGMRDAEFKDSFEAFVVTADLATEKMLPPEKVCVHHLLVWGVADGVSSDYAWVSCSKFPLGLDYVCELTPNVVWVRPRAG